MLRETTREATSGPDLGIELHSPPSTFQPGDSIGGRIYRQTAIISPQASLTVTLFGCLATKVNDNPSHVMTLLAISQTLFKGAIHIPPDSTRRHEWPFNIRLPKNPDHRRLTADYYKQLPLFLPLDQDSVNTHPLPPSSQTKSPYFYASVDYFLEAKLVFRRKGVRDVVKAQHPLPLRLTKLGPPVADCQLQPYDIQRIVHSQRLIPGMHGASLSLRQRVKKFLHTSSVPRLTLQLQIEIPTTIQLNHPDPISFTVKSIPTWSKSSQILENVPQTAKLVRFWAVLLSHCEIPAEIHPRYKAVEKYTLGCDFPSHPEPPIEMRCFTDEEPVDIGKATNLRLVDPESLVPSFTTYSMKVSHTLSYEMRWDIEKESIKIQDEQPVVILPESRDRDVACQQHSLGNPPSNLWSGMADDMQSPPSFEETEKERKAQAQLKSQFEEKPQPGSRTGHVFSAQRGESSETGGGSGM